MLKRLIGRAWCALGFHDEEGIEPWRGIAGGARCLRDGCGFRVEPIRWPPPPRNAFAQVEECPERGPLSQNVQLDDRADTATVYGVKVSGELLRTISEPTRPGVWFRIVKVEDGVATVERRVVEALT